MKLPTSILQSTSWSPPTRRMLLTLVPILRVVDDPFDFQVLDQHHGIAVGQDIPVGILDQRFRVGIASCSACNGPFMAAIRTHVVFPIGVGVFLGTFGASGNSRHDGVQP